MHFWLNYHIENKSEYNRMNSSTIFSKTNYFCNTFHKLCFCNSIIINYYGQIVQFKGPFID